MTDRTPSRRPRGRSEERPPDAPRGEAHEACEAPGALQGLPLFPLGLLVGIELLALRSELPHPQPPLPVEAVRERFALPEDPADWSARELRLLPGLGERRALDVVAARVRRVQEDRDARPGPNRGESPEVLLAGRPGQEPLRQGLPRWEPLRWEDVRGIGVRTARRVRAALAAHGAPRLEPGPVRPRGRAAPAVDPGGSLPEEVGGESAQAAPRSKDAPLGPAADEPSRPSRPAGGMSAPGSKPYTPATMSPRGADQDPDAGPGRSADGASSSSPSAGASDPGEGRRAPDPLPHSEVDFVLGFAIGEDLGPGDVTTEVLIPQERRGRGRLVSKAEGVVSGLDIFSRVFQLIDPHVRFEPLVQDGDRIWPGDELLRVEGNARTLLVGERTALNFVQRMSGIATHTFRFVEAAQGRARICDTRKTTPGLRQFEKYAVECGGAINHRFGLFDEVMVKNNHIDLSGNSLIELLYALRASHGDEMRITAEARDEAEAFDAVSGGADCVLLDNMDPEVLRSLCPRLRSAAADQGRKVELEASGGITLETVGSVAASGVDRISVGALTHSSAGLDLSFWIEVLS